MIKVYSSLIALGLLLCLMVNGPLASAASPAPINCTNPGNQYQCLDFRNYYPTSTIGHWHNFYNGWPFSYYYYMPGPTINSSGVPSYTSNFQGAYVDFWNLNKPGQVYTISKSYNTSTTSTPNFCTKTYSNVFLGSDLSVTELGDYLDVGTSCSPSIFLGYHDPVTGSPTGLSWASPGGLKTEITGFPDGSPVLPQTLNLNVWTWQNNAFSSNGSTVWNYTKVLEVLPTYTPPYGRSATTNVWGAGNGQTYNNVVHLIFYHGVSAGGPNSPETTCYQNLDPSWIYSQYYVHMPGFNSYATEYYLAPGVGIIQETALLYNENNTYFGSSTCTGMIMFPNPTSVTDAAHTTAQQAWTAYIDNS